MTNFKAKNILFLEPYYGGSHKVFLDSLVKYTQHNIEMLTLPARHWKWRSYASAFNFLDKIQKNYDLIIVSEMVDISLIKSEIQTPIIQYVHENQFFYPKSSHDQDQERGRDQHYHFHHLKNLKLAKWSYFNSDFNKKTMLGGCSQLLKNMPDHNDIKIPKTQSVLPLGLELKPFFKRFKKNNEPIIIWNHRWEHDKNPKEFFEILDKLPFEFKLILAGSGKGNAKELFEEKKQKFAEKIIHYGKAKNLETYLSLIHMSDLSIVTSKQDFFGISAIELLVGGVQTYLPHRMSFPEIIPTDYHQEYLYDDQNDLLAKISDYADNSLDSLQDQLLKYDWSEMIKKYDNEFLRHIEENHE